MTNKILLVEDDSRLADMVCDYLSEAGYCVSHAPDAATGLSMHAGGQFHAVRKHEIENDGMELPVCMHGQTGRRVGRVAHPITRLTEIVTDHLRQAGIVFNEKDLVRQDLVSSVTPVPAAALASAF